MRAPRVGDPAPDFTAQAHTGQRIALADYRGERVVVVYFYPKDDTLVCTREACAFRDAFADFLDAGAVVLGISADPPESHRAFAERHRLPFPLLSDEDGALRRAFGVPKTLGVLDGRVTYVIDREGVVRHAFRSPLAARRHVAGALAVVRRLVAEG